MDGMEGKEGKKGKERGKKWEECRNGRKVEMEGMGEMDGKKE
jgi:hypothetical protein